MSEKILIKNARAIVTCDELDQVFYGADLLIDGPRIEKIGRGLPEQGAHVIDGTGKFVYPGLVNTHHHFFQTFVRNMMTIDYPNMSVQDLPDFCPDRRGCDLLQLPDRYGGPAQTRLYLRI